MGGFTALQVGMVYGLVLLIVYLVKVGSEINRAHHVGGIQVSASVILWMAVFLRFTPFVVYKMKLIDTMKLIGFCITSNLEE